MSLDISIYQLSSLSEKHLDELSRLLIDTVIDGASIGFLPSITYEEANQYWSNVIEPSTILLVATLDDSICGTIQLQLATKANAIHRAEIAKLMVHPQNRRFGIARKLLREAENRAKQDNRTTLILDTREGDPSNKLYLSENYIQAGIIPQYAISSSGQLDATVFYYKLLA